MRVFFRDEYVLARHAFETTRKARWVADGLVAAALDGVEIVAPPVATAEQLTRVHARSYIDAVRVGEPRELAESQGFSWDPALWTMTCASTGGVIAASLDAIENGVSGSLSSGLHHARRDRGDGSCTFNGLAVAARVALDVAKTISSVAILDVDAHCGGGTHSLLSRDDRVQLVDVSTDAYDEFDPRAPHSLSVITRPDDYLAAVDSALASIESHRLPGLLIYNAGMDSFEGCSDGALRGVSDAMLAERESKVFSWSKSRGVPVVFVLAGGYTFNADDPAQRAQLVALHLSTIRAATQIARRD
jgi:acetoin utilization deacetylase AcuC-like enzyme